MLYTFRTPLFRQWNFQLIHGRLSSIPNLALAKHFKDCHDVREKILGALQEAHTKQYGGIGYRADTLVVLLEEYIPMLETLIVLVEESLDGKLQGLDTVWTSVLTDTWEAKTFSENLQHEKLQVYFLYGQAVYSQAEHIHSENCEQVQTLEIKRRKKGDKADISILKQLISQMKRAAGIWDWLSSVKSKCYPITCKNPSPEVFQAIPRALSLMALANAQEFMVQCAVETGKPHELISKLCEGISLQLMEALQIAEMGLGAETWMLSHDIILYLDRRSRMYHGIALKYQSDVKFEQKKYDEQVEVLRVSRASLSGLHITPLMTTERDKDNAYPLSKSLLILSRSIVGQLRTVSTLYSTANQENPPSHHDQNVPLILKHYSVDHVNFIELTAFTPLEPIALFTKKMDEVTINMPSKAGNLTAANATAVNDNKPEPEANRALEDDQSLKKNTADAPAQAAEPASK